MDKIEEKQEELERTILEILALENDLAILKEKNNNLKPLTKPTIVNNLSEMAQCIKAFNDHQDAIQRIANEINWTDNNISHLKFKIMELIPVRNVWVRAGDYAVGLLTEARGGNHTVVAIEKWCEDLPELKDRLTYT